MTEEEARLAPTFVDRNRYYLAFLRAGRAPALRDAERMYGEIVDLAFARRRGEDETGAGSTQAKHQRPARAGLPRSRLSVTPRRGRAALDSRPAGFLKPPRNAA